MHLSLLAECRSRAEQALSKLTNGADRDATREMKLYAALAVSSVYSKGAAHEFITTWMRALEIAEKLNNAEYQLRALWGLWAFYLAIGEWRLSLEIAQQFYALAADCPDTNDRAIADRMIGFPSIGCATKRARANISSACSSISSRLPAGPITSPAFSSING